MVYKTNKNNNYSWGYVHKIVLMTKGARRLKTVAKIKARSKEMQLLYQIVDKQNWNIFDNGRTTGEARKS